MTDEKIKFLMRIDPGTDRKIKSAMPLANCRSQNEFVEKALRFYCDYISSQDASAVLPPMLVSALRTTVQSTEDHVCRLLFQCVRNVKRTHGMVSLEDAAANQSGGA